MPVNFLCGSHREQLLADEELAEHNWLEWMKQAAHCHEEDDINSAIPFLGCAFELSGHLLQRSWPSAPKALSRFTAASICLAKAYHLLGNDQARGFILDRADERIADKVTDIRCYQFISDSMRLFNWAAVNHAIQRWYKSAVPISTYSSNTRSRPLMYDSVTLH